METKIIDVQPMRNMSECRVRFGNYGRSFPSPAIYRSALKKKVEMSGSVFFFSSRLSNVSTDAFDMP